jgi:hypothetical protein
MTIEDTLEQLSHQQYPHQVDVVDRVMAQVEQHPYLQPVRHRVVSWQRIGAVAAAAVVALVAVNVTLFHDNYDNEGMGSMIAQVNDYSTWNTVEEAAVNPLEYLYEEDD